MSSVQMPTERILFCWENFLTNDSYPKVKLNEQSVYESLVLSLLVCYWWSRLRQRSTAPCGSMIQKSANSSPCQWHSQAFQLSNRAVLFRDHYFRIVVMLSSGEILCPHHPHFLVEPIFQFPSSCSAAASCRLMHLKGGVDRLKVYVWCNACLMVPKVIVVVNLLISNWPDTILQRVKCILAFWSHGVVLWGSPILPFVKVEHVW